MTQTTRRKGVEEVAVSDYNVARRWLEQFHPGVAERIDAWLDQRRRGRMRVDRYRLQLARQEPILGRRGRLAFLEQLEHNTRGVRAGHAAGQRDAAGSTPANTS